MNPVTLKFEQSIQYETEPVMIVLKCHLFIENQLEQFIILNIARGDRVIESANLSFHQKLCLVHALDFIPDNIISSLRSLNKLRNRFAHDLDVVIGGNEIVKIGSPLGKVFTKQKNDAQGDNNVLLGKVVHYLCGYVAGVCARIEEHQLENSSNETVQV